METFDENRRHSDGIIQQTQKKKPHSLSQIPESQAKGGRNDSSQSDDKNQRCLGDEPGAMQLERSSGAATGETKSDQ